MEPRHGHGDLFDPSDEMCTSLHYRNSVPAMEIRGSYYVSQPPAQLAKAAPNECKRGIDSDLPMPL